MTMIHIVLLQITNNVGCETYVLCIYTKTLGRASLLTEMNIRWAGPPPGLRTGSLEGERLLKSTQAQLDMVSLSACQGQGQ